MTPSPPYGGDSNYSGSTSQVYTQVVGPAAATAVRLGRASTKGITVTIPVTCAEPADGTCRFKLMLTITEKLNHGKLIAITAATTHKTVTLGEALIELTGGEHKNVRITLNRIGRRLLSARHSLAARIAVTESGKTIASSEITFRVSGRRR